MATIVSREDLRWWEKDERPHLALYEHVKRIQRITAIRRESALYYACLYDDAPIVGLGNVSTVWEPSRLAFNVVRQNVDALTAKIAGQNRPLPMATTTDGNYSQQRRAQNLSRLFEGTFSKVGVWSTSPQIARDAALFGTGITHTYRVGKRIYHEKVPPWEIHVDPREAMYGNPQTIYMRRWIDRTVLETRYPEFVDKIETAEADRFDRFDLGYDDTCDLVPVIEGWHLPSADGEGDGRHCIVLSNATLFDEEWKRDYFPFDFLTMAPPLTGIFGVGIGQMIQGLQYTINDMAESWQQAHHMQGGYVAVEEGSSVNIDHFENAYGVIMTYRGNPPQWITPAAVHPDVWRGIEALIEQSFASTGVSQLGARSDLPKGLESGLAIANYNNIETERFSLFARRYEQYHVDLAWKLFDLFEEIAGEMGGYSVHSMQKQRGKRRLLEVDWKEAKLDRDEFTLEVFPTSLLAKEPAMKMQQVLNMAQAGWLTQDEGKMLLQFPDFEHVQSLSQASHDVVEEILHRLREGNPKDPKTYVQPEPLFDLHLCVALGQQHYLRAKVDGVEDANLELILRFVMAAQNMLAAAQPKPPGGPTNGQGMPGPTAPMGPPPNAGPMAPGPAPQG